MPKIVNFNDLIEKSKKIHDNKYDYSKSEYINAKEKVCITCPKHGEFWQKIHNHLNGKGCPICGKTKIWDSRGRLTTEDFIEKAIKKHGNKYDYSKVEYIDAKTKICIICNKLGKNGKEHGEFWQTPSNHINNKKYGCHKCGHHISSSEEKIYDFINDNLKKVKIERQYILPFLKNGSSHMSIDIFMTEYNIAIEYQGEQHFKPVKHFGGDEKFKMNMKRDLFKYEKCILNGIDIIYFTYENKIIPDDYFAKVFVSENELITYINNKIKCQK